MITDKLTKLNTILGSLLIKVSSLQNANTARLMNKYLVRISNLFLNKL